MISAIWLTLTSICSGTSMVFLPAEAELVAEQIQENQHYDDQQHDRKDSAAASAAGFDDRRAIDRFASRRCRP